MKVLPTVFFLLIWILTPAAAQQSASYRLDEHVLNLGGTPEDGVTASSASYRISLDSLGEAAVRSGLFSASYGMDASFISAYPAPGEVFGVHLSDSTTLVWNAERSAGDYNVYRDGLLALSGGQYGECWRQDVPETSVTDADPLSAGDGWFYLVTVENRLEEEGTKGSDGSGATRGGTACP